MPDYKKLYFTLFGQLADILEHLDQHNYGSARDLLIQVMVKAEDVYLDESDETPS